MKLVEMFTDGALKGDKVGGWGVLLRCGSIEKTFCGGEINTTNNRMEMMAVIVGLQKLTKPCKVHITTDSQYVINGITKWMTNWKKNNWMYIGWGSTPDIPVKNKDLWLILEEEVNKHDVTWNWVKGHTGHRENEIADDLANEGVKKARVELL